MPGQLFFSRKTGRALFGRALPVTARQKEDFREGSADRRQK